MKTFIAGGGLGDCVLILNKFKQLAAPRDTLIYYVAEQQRNFRDVIGEFWKSQNIQHEIRIVPDTSRPLNHYDRAAYRKLNPLIYGAGIVYKGNGRWVWYPFDTFAVPYMHFECNPPSYEPYFVVQSDAGTMKYRRHKNWLHTEWIEDFISGARRTGLKCVLVGSNDIGIRNADYRRFDLPLKDLFGILNHAEFVLGLQGFVTLVALFMHKRVLLKRENLRVIFNYFHPRWFRHGRIFSEPRQWPAAKTETLLHWALDKKTDAVTPSSG